MPGGGGSCRSGIFCFTGTRLRLRCLHEFAYNACIMSKQYTIRSIPAAIDRALRRLAQKESKSLNTVALEVLARGLELDAKVIEHSDLDNLVGCWQEDSAFDEAVADFERIDDES